MAPPAELPSGIGVALASIFGDDGRLDIEATTEQAVSCAVGTGDPVAARAVALTTEGARAHVADAVLVLAAGDMPASELYPAVAAAAGTTPVLAYHLPVLSPPGVPVDAMPALPVVGIKDSSGDADRLAPLLHDGQEVYVGSPNLLSTAGPCGARGALLGLANTVPEACAAAWAGDHDAQRELFHAHVRSSRDFPASLTPGGRR
jgi:4-hydroxy-tetrahydrodipicolinate synthase